MKVKSIIEELEEVKKYEREELLITFKYYLNIYTQTETESEKLYKELKHKTNNELAILIIQLKYNKRYEKILNDKFKNYL